MWLASLRRLPRGIWALGLTSMFMDVSSELVHSLLPLYLSRVLGAGFLTIGLIEGVAEATASITKLFSGALSDARQRRKPLALLGYGLSALTKPVFPLASSVGWVAAARFADRIGKGIRGAPRDALVAEIAPPDIRGAAYGLRQALDSVGALLGPLLAIVLMKLFANDMQATLWVATIPAGASVAILFAGVREPDGRPSGSPLIAGLRGVARLGRAYWLVVAVSAVFTLARFSEAFLVLRAEGSGVPIAYVPAVMVAMNLAYSATAYPAGAAADKGSQRKLLAGGLAALVISDLILAAAPSALYVLLGAAVWGLHMGLTQGLFAKLVADTAPAAMRGTAFGAFHLVTGISALFASLLAGALWAWFGPPAAFLAGAILAALAALGVGAITPR